VELGDAKIGIERRVVLDRAGRNEQDGGSTRHRTIDSNVARTLSTSPVGAFSAAKTSSSRMNSIALTSTI